jgi:hypothetical protein
MNDFNKLSDIPDDLLTEEQIGRLERRVMLGIGDQESAALGKKFFNQVRQVAPLLDKLSEYKLEVDRLRAYIRQNAEREYHDECNRRSESGAEMLVTIREWMHPAEVFLANKEII